MISYKEVRESKYWIRLLKDSNLLDESISNVLLGDCEELLRIISSIQKSVRNSK